MHCKINSERIVELHSRFSILRHDLLSMAQERGSEAGQRREGGCRSWRGEGRIDKGRVLGPWQEVGGGNIKRQEIDGQA